MFNFAVILLPVQCKQTNIIDDNFMNRLHSLHVVSTPV